MFAVDGAVTPWELSDPGSSCSPGVQDPAVPSSGLPSLCHAL